MRFDRSSLVPSWAVASGRQRTDAEFAGSETTHVDLAAWRPFFMVTCSMSLLFVFSLHLTQ